MMYTQFWNDSFVSNTTNLGKFKLCLEIGCFEGLTSNYIVENLLNTNGKLICVDPLTDQYLNGALSEENHIDNVTCWSYFNGQFDRFIHNTNQAINQSKIELIRKMSVDAFPDLIRRYKETIDLIYIDGDHRSDGVYLDAIQSFELCKSKGYILFDDYLWLDNNNQAVTKIGIDRFLLEYSGLYELVKENYQILIKKL